MNSQNNKLYGLSKVTIDMIVSNICENKKVEKIILFGSRAKGNFKKGSDIDIAVFSENLSYSEIMKIKVAVGELPLPNTIDILDFESIKNKELREHILRVGVTLYSN